MLFLQVASLRKHLIHVRYCLAIAQLRCMANYPKTQRPVTISMYSHTRRSVGWLGFSRSRQASSKLSVGSGCVPCVSPTSVTSRLPAMHLSHDDEKAQKRRGESKWTAHFTLCLGPHQPKLVTRPNRVTKGMGCGFVSISLLLLTYVCALRQNSRASLCFLSCSVK